MIETIDSKNINDYLKTQNKIPMTDKPMFRLVWSNDLLEHRQILDGPKTGQVVLGPKYPWIQSKWVFEKWYPPEMTNHGDLPFTREGSFEPIYVFQDKNSNSLPLNKQVIEFLVYVINKPMSSPDAIKSRLREEQLMKDIEEDKFFDEHCDISSDISSNLHFGEGIIVPATYDVLPPNLRRKQ